MSAAQILKILMVVGPFLEPMLLKLENDSVQPELKKLIEGVTNPELKAFLMAVDAELDSFIKTEIAKV